MKTIPTEMLRPGDVLLVHLNSFHMSSLPIRLGNFFKRGFAERKWTHTAMYVGDGKVIESLAFGVGVVERDFADTYLKGTHNIRVLRHKNASPEKLRKAVEFCKSQVGDKYEQAEQVYFVLNYLVSPSFRFALENEFVDRLFRNERSFFCSQLVARSFLEAGCYPFERAPRKIMPLDFYNRFVFDKVAEMILPHKERRIVFLLKNTIFYSLYLIAALFFFAIDALLAVVAVFFAHIALFVVFLGVMGASVTETAITWIKRQVR